MVPQLLIMSATVTPKSGVPTLMRTDPADRLEDYRRALAFYLDHVPETVDKIVFVENSQSDITVLRQLVEARGKTPIVEFIQFDGLDYPPSFNRGYGEFLLLDYAMDHSESVSDALARAPNAIIWKVTGRYIVENFAAMVGKAPSRFDLYCNYRNHPRKLTDSYLMAWTKAGYEKYMRGSYEFLKQTPETEKLHSEELFRMHLDARETSDVKIAKRFRRTAELAGVRAGDNKDYAAGSRLKYRLRAMAHRFLPWVWI